MRGADGPLGKAGVVCGAKKWVKWYVNSFHGANIL
jgi:hypothetical protein